MLYSRVCGTEDWLDSGLPRIKRYEVPLYILLSTLIENIMYTQPEKMWNGTVIRTQMPRVPRKKYSSACWMGFPNQFLYFPYQRKDGGDSLMKPPAQDQKDPMHIAANIWSREERGCAES
jgi:hypothetical protein